MPRTFIRPPQTRSMVSDPRAASAGAHMWDLPVGSRINIDLGGGEFAGATTLTPIRVAQNGTRHHIVGGGTVQIDRVHVFTGQEIRLVPSAR